MRLRCPCGRNLADVRDDSQPSRISGHRNPLWTPDGLSVFTRPNVRGRTYRPRPPASEGIGAPRTYGWDCYCGETWELRHERISQMWADYRTRPGSIVHVILG